jgi:alkanesulfonate monooxygenase SsuD/methylene tetrahydromethanopterin reductase-like flavin-dependent oxidoreductase (luciferase family)
MKFGVFYEMQLPRPWTRTSEYELFQNALIQIELADRLGYDYAWEVEHHFTEEYSHSSAPCVFLGAASQRTKQIRLGHGVVQLPTNHIARVAERVSTLDLLSNGRVELGTGEGSATTEIHPFNIRFRDKREIWEESIQALIPMFRDEGTEFHGKYIDFPLRNVIPKPRQTPHPPLWLACSSMATIEMAARRGMGALGFQFVSPEAATAWVNCYYNNIVHNLDRLADYQVNPNIAMVCGFMCAETDELAYEKAAGWTFFIFALQYYSKNGYAEPGKLNMWDKYLEWRETPKAKEALHTGLIGSPDTIRRKLREYEKSNVDQVILLNQSGKNTHEDICASLELFAREVMPEFHARDPEHQTWKAQVMSGAITLEDRDTTAFPKFLGQPDEHLAASVGATELKRMLEERDRASGTVGAGAG